MCASFSTRYCDPNQEPCVSNPCVFFWAILWTNTVLMGQNESTNFSSTLCVNQNNLVPACLFGSTFVLSVFGGKLIGQKSRHTLAALSLDRLHNSKQPTMEPSEASNTQLSILHLPPKHRTIPDSFCLLQPIRPTFKSSAKLPKAFAADFVQKRLFPAIPNVRPTSHLDRLVKSLLPLPNSPNFQSVPITTSFHGVQITTSSWPNSVPVFLPNLSGCLGAAKFCACNSKSPVLGYLFWAAFREACLGPHKSHPAFGRERQA